MRTARAPLGTVLAAAVIGLLALVVVLSAIGRPASGDSISTSRSTMSGAIVNLDEPTEIDGQLVPLGRQLAAEIVANPGPYDWTVTGEPEAADGLADGTFDVVVTIPETFSAAAMSFADEPGLATSATIDVATRPGTSADADAVAQLITSSAAATLGTDLTENYLQNVLIGFTTTGEQLGEAADGASDLADGATQSADGAAQLADGLGQSADGATQLADGTLALADGASAAASGAGEFAAGAAQLADGADQAASGVRELATGTGALADGAAQSADGAAQLADGADQAATGMDALATGGAQLATGADDLAGGAEELAAGVAASADGASQLADGVGQLAENTGELTAGATGVADGAAGLATGLGDLATQLDGQLPQLEELDAGAQGVATGLAGYLAFLQASCDAGETMGAACASLGDLGALVTGAQGVSAGTAALVDPATGLPAAAAGVDALATGADELATGAQGLADGVGQLAGGITALNDPAQGAPALAAGLGQLSAGASELATGADGLATGVTGLSGGIQEASTGISGLADGAGALAGGAAELSAGTGALAAGADQAAGGVEQVASGTGDLAVGAGDLASGVGDLAAGTGELAAGAVGLADGTGQLAEGADGLADGTSQIAEGAGELAGGLQTAVSELPSYTDSEVDSLSAAIATPVTAPSVETGVPATGMAAVTLMLWLGAFALLLTFPALLPTAFGSVRSSLRLALSALARPALWSLALGALAGAIVAGWARADAGDYPAAVLIGAVSSLAFLLLQAAFVVAAPVLGRLLALLLAGVAVAAVITPLAWDSALPTGAAAEALAGLLVPGAPSGTGALVIVILWGVAGLVLTWMATAARRTTRVGALERAA
ncbi:hypothetical protein [Serinibacter salmoneus]|uniref:Putative membrane protein n=1 Tax=Serinibacter salmoneus TaxID=556530 RepID=A0A2A9D3U9_9MICO|nr:hypothetical protein [Serinibacter salmoneus]PFG21016.1 putative membrane protein [Serinibacter salmoneus]